ncbi:hypothetical protein H2248_002280 [Termitomyces sp. 'cryptogamus']|nr:hypothetical protein H2248_002280 [Termitomyces sp. 'cryptogamus']
MQTMSASTRDPDTPAKSSSMPNPGRPKHLLHTHKATMPAGPPAAVTIVATIAVCTLSCSPPLSRLVGAIYPYAAQLLIQYTFE